MPVPDWGDVKSTPACGCCSGPPAYVGLQAGTTTPCGVDFISPVRDYEFGYILVNCVAVWVKLFGIDISSTAPTPSPNTAKMVTSKSSLFAFVRQIKALSILFGMFLVGRGKFNLTFLSTFQIPMARFLYILNYYAVRTQINAAFCQKSPRENAAECTVLKVIC
jgi:hypothetical protein